jgi:hypothetical protein
MTSPKFKGRKAKVTLHDLPQGAGPNFGTLYIPLVKGYMGILPAWTDPQIPVFKKHWINVYGGLICGWDKDDPVRTLVRDFTLWRLISNKALDRLPRGVLAQWLCTTRYASS